MHKQHSLTFPKNRRLALALAACTLALAGCCGGGGGSGDGDGGLTQPPPAQVDPLVAMRGFWSGNLSTAPDGATRSSAVVMPDGTGWIVFESAAAPTAVLRVPFVGSAVNATDATVVGSGFYYRLSDATRNAVTVNPATASTNGTFSGTAVVSGNPGTGFNWTAVPGFTTQSLQADVTGRFAGTAGNGAVAVSWTINDAGAVTGTSSTGCAYSGTLQPASGTAVYNLAVNENCAGTVRVLSGIATLASNKTSLRVVFTADNLASGGLFALTRQ